MPQGVSTGAGKNMQPSRCPAAACRPAWSPWQQARRWAAAPQPRQWRTWRPAGAQQRGLSPPPHPAGGQQGIPVGCGSTCRGFRPGCRPQQDEQGCLKGGQGCWHVLQPSDLGILQADCVVQTAPARMRVWQSQLAGQLFTGTGGAANNSPWLQLAAARQGAAPASWPPAQHPWRCQQTWWRG